MSFAFEEVCALGLGLLREPLAVALRASCLRQSISIEESRGSPNPGLSLLYPVSRMDRPNGRISRLRVRVLGVSLSS
jgi:hypothetical protein